jgi:hypothetical protein
VRGDPAQADRAERYGTEVPAEVGTVKIVLAAIAFVGFFVAAVCRPQSVSCLRGFHVEGVHRDGTFECARPYGCREYRGPRGGFASTCDGEQRYPAVIHCTGGTRGITNYDGDTVGCQPRGWP